MKVKKENVILWLYISDCMPLGKIIFREYQGVVPLIPCER